MRRSILTRSAALGAALACVGWLMPWRAESAACANPRQMTCFKTCADVAKAEQEGAVTFCTTDPEPGTAQVVAEFYKTFPKIKPAFIRLHAGNLYAKLSAERQTKSYLADVMAISEMTFATDLQKKGGYLLCGTPELAAYRPAFKSKPEGYWIWGALIVAGIAYHPKLVPEADRPINWDDAVHPRFAGQINMKLSTSGLQHGVWYRLRQLYGEDFWQKFSELKPRAFDSYVQQFDRMVNGQDKMVHGAQYSGYLQFEAKGADVGFIQPKDGMIEISDLVVDYGDVRAVAGLEDPSGGVIRLGRTTVYSTSGRRNLPSEKRGVSMVFQSYAIWPHMTVFDNVAYGLKVRKMPKAEIAANVARVLDLMQMRVELRELQKRPGITALYVTHDQEEALAISDRLIVMNAGWIEQIGTPEAIYRHPRAVFVADFVGNANMVQGRVQGVVQDGVVSFVSVAGPVFQAAWSDGAAGLIHRRMFHGDFIQYVIDWPCGQLLVRLPPTTHFVEGEAVVVPFAAEHCVLL